MQRLIIKCAYKSYQAYLDGINLMIHPEKITLPMPDFHLAKRSSMMTYEVKVDEMLERELERVRLEGLRMLAKTKKQ